MISRWAGPVIAGAFLLSMIAIGHGIAPTGFFLVIFTLALSPYALVGWYIILLLLSGTFLSGRTRSIVVWIGSGASFLSWLWLLVEAEWGTTILLSAHYLAALFYFLVYRPVVHEDES